MPIIDEKQSHGRPPASMRALVLPGVCSFKRRTLLSGPQIPILQWEHGKNSKVLQLQHSMSLTLSALTPEAPLLGLANQLGYNRSFAF